MYYIVKHCGLKQQLKLFCITNLQNVQNKVFMLIEMEERQFRAKHKRLSVDYRWDTVPHQGPQGYQGELSVHWIVTCTLETVGTGFLGTSNEGEWQSQVARGHLNLDSQLKWFGGQSEVSSK